MIVLGQTAGGAESLCFVGSHTMGRLGNLRQGPRLRVRFWVIER